MQNNQHYQTSLQNIHDVTTEESNLVASAEQHARISDAADVSSLLRIILPLRSTRR